MYRILNKLFKWDYAAYKSKVRRVYVSNENVAYFKELPRMELTDTMLKNPDCVVWLTCKQSKYFTVKPLKTVLSSYEIQNFLDKMSKQLKEDLPYSNMLACLNCVNGEIEILRLLRKELELNNIMIKKSIVNCFRFLFIVASFYNMTLVEILHIMQSQTE